jgi:hypothetical protein
MNTSPPALPEYTSPAPVKKKSGKGFFPPALVKAAAFYIISLCILAGVVVCILAIWDFTQRDTLWRFASSFLVVSAGTLLFAFVNGMFGERTEG